MTLSDAKKLDEIIKLLSEEFGCEYSLKRKRENSGVIMGESSPKRMCNLSAKSSLFHGNSKPLVNKEEDIILWQQHRK